jgi:methionyl-tRNA formyltransferase
VGRLVIWSAAVGTVEGAPGVADGSGPALAPGTAAAPGTFDLEGLVVERGGRLDLREVQPAGGKRMPWDAYVRGRPAIVGARVLPGGSTTGA